MKLPADTPTFRLYRQIRRAHPYYTARDALQIARRNAEPNPLDWTSNRRGELVALWTVEPFRLRATAAPDEYRDDWRGTFTDTRGPATIPNPYRTGPPPDPNYHTGRRGPEPRYFRLDSTDPVAETAAYYRRTMARHAAYCRALALARQEARDAREAEPYTITVQVYAAGTELARATVGGVELSGPPEAERELTDAALELAPAALEDARAKLTELTRLHVPPTQENAA
jgi:hypothetical protein